MQAQPSDAPYRQPGLTFPATTQSQPTATPVLSGTVGSSQNIQVVAPLATVCAGDARTSLIASLEVGAVDPGVTALRWFFVSHA